jgi:LuxR family maltose regulon positive regulatory protein
VPWRERLRRAANGVVVHAAPGSYEPASPLQLLTERELEVLRLLPSRLTVREIAETLYISVNTLKFHLRVLYRKLGVNTRAEAAKLVRRTEAQLYANGGHARPSA